MEDVKITPNIKAKHNNPIIKIIGVGGGGSNAVEYMSRMGIDGVDFIVCNTDIQDLRASSVKNRIQIGKQITEGLGAGAVPNIGKQALLENESYIKQMLSENTEVVFITAGMGGGTGTGAAPEIARIAHDMGKLTIGIVTVPFSFEGEQKVQQAMDGIDELEKSLDALSIVVSDRILQQSMTLTDAFAMSNNVLAVAVRSLAEIITVPGYINVDLMDVISVMRDGGITLIGSGEAEGKERAQLAFEQAITSPLLQYNDIRGASNVLVHMQYDEEEMFKDEHTWILEQVQRRVGQNVDLIWGMGQKNDLGKKLRISIIATGFNGHGVKVDTHSEDFQNVVNNFSSNIKVEPISDTVIAPVASSPVVGSPVAGPVSEPISDPIEAEFVNANLSKTVDKPTIKQETVRVETPKPEENKFKVELRDEEDELVMTQQTRKDLEEKSRRKRRTENNLTKKTNIWLHDKLGTGDDVVNKDHAM